MPATCPQCGKTIGDGAGRCPSCGASSDPFGTILPPSPRAPSASSPFQPAPPPKSKPRPPRPPEPAPPRVEPADRPRPAPLPPAPLPPPPPPAYRPPPPASSGTGKIGKIWNILRGGDEPSAAAVGPAPVDHHDPAPPAYLAPPHAEATPVEYPANPPYRADGPEDGTVFYQGVDVGRINVPRVTHYLHILDKSGVWREFAEIPPRGLRVGARKSGDFPDMETLAARHLELFFERGLPFVRDLGALNGVFLRVAEPVELTDGARFRVGSHVVAFRQGEPPGSGPALRSDEAEEFFSRDMGALAFLDLIRPDGQPGLRFPITRPDFTIIGRGGAGKGGTEAHIVLAGDPVVSTQHALIRHDAGRFRLEDLRSSNGTYLRVEEAAPLPPGAVILAGRVLFRVVDSSGPMQSGDRWGASR